MSYSKARQTNFDLKKIYNKWRMATLGLNLAGLVTFMFALGLSDLTKPLMIVATALLWIGVLVARKYISVEEGKPFEPVARVSYVISLLLALVVTVLTAITFLSA
ncbi:MAG: hypothetical protein ISF22_00085 [Methanomassiliicoccus sp.]|nr:hypothetical protein [Methanomassiliicoccus sp.]